MGASTSWVAVKGRSEEEVLRVLGLEKTTDRERGRASGLMGMVNQQGWYVVMGRYEYLETAPLVELSKGAEVVAGCVEEHVMYSETRGLRDGAESWRVRHDAEEDPAHLDARGKLPGEFGAIREALMAKQKGEMEVDYVFDIAVQLGQALTGFGVDGEDQDGEWAMLTPVRKKRAWEFWKK